MARSIESIHGEILTSIEMNAVLEDLNSPSKVAIYRLFAFIIATAIYLHELIFDTHKVEVENLLFNQKSGRLSWYRFMAFNFQYGYDLVPDKDYYDNTGVSEEDIEASKIIKYCAVVEPEDESRILIKIAKEENGGLTNFTDDDQVEAVEAYFEEIKYPGKITIINYPADKLYLNVQIKRDALVLAADGTSKLDATRPVEEAIAEFMTELDFNGELLLSFLIAKIKAVPGVLDATLLSAETEWYQPTLDGFGASEPIFISKVAVSGYFEVVNYDNISYVV
jgi:hypothetical protein